MKPELTLVIMVILAVAAGALGLIAYETCYEGIRDFCANASTTGPCGGGCFLLALATALTVIGLPALVFLLAMEEEEG